MEDSSEAMHLGIEKYTTIQGRSGWKAVGNEKRPLLWHFEDNSYLERTSSSSLCAGDELRALCMQWKDSDQVPLHCPRMEMHTFTDTWSTTARCRSAVARSSAYHQTRKERRPTSLEDIPTMACGGTAFRRLIAFRKKTVVHAQIKRCYASTVRITTRSRSSPPTTPTNPSPHRQQRRTSRKLLRRRSTAESIAEATSTTQRT